jgi:hypothetical protein
MLQSQRYNPNLTTRPTVARTSLSGHLCQEDTSNICPKLVISIHFDLCNLDTDVHIIERFYFRPTVKIQLVM